MNLVDTLKKWGLTVVEIDGWQQRGWTVNRFGQKWSPRGAVMHHTANGGFRGVDAPSLGVCINGRPPSPAEPTGLPGPLCQMVLGYSGTVYLIAGLGANHAGSGGWGTLQGNGSVWGIEAENNGVGEPWPQVQLDAYYRCAAALAEYTGFAPGSICGHKEWTTAKIDPAGIDMNGFRRRVATLLEEGPAPTPPNPTKGTKMIDGALSPKSGRAERVHIANGKVYLRWQTTPNGMWAGPVSLHSPGDDPGAFDNVTIYPNQDGRLEIVAFHSAYGVEFTKVQNADSSWRKWAKV